MLKYKIIAVFTALAFVLGCVVVFLNKGAYGLIRPKSGREIIVTTAGDIAILIGGVVIVLAIVAIIGYKLYKNIRKLYFKITKKRDPKIYTPDADEFYTKSQSSEDISKFYISATRGRLEDEDK